MRSLKGVFDGTPDPFADLRDVVNECALSARSGPFALSVRAPGYSQPTSVLQSKLVFERESVKVGVYSWYKRFGVKTSVRLGRGVRGAVVLSRSPFAEFKLAWKHNSGAVHVWGQPGTGWFEAVVVAQPGKNRAAIRIKRKGNETRMDGVLDAAGIEVRVEKGVFSVARRFRCVEVGGSIDAALNTGCILRLRGRGCLVEVQQQKEDSHVALKRVCRNGSSLEVMGTSGDFRGSVQWRIGEEAVGKFSCLVPFDNYTKPRLGLELLFN